MKYCFKFCGELTEVTLECNYGGEKSFEHAFFFCNKLTAGSIKVKGSGGPGANLQGQCL